MDTLRFRGEITGRVTVLHNQLTAASCLSFLLILAIIWLNQSQQVELVPWLLLGIQPVFAALAFNYQANQITMEALAKYLITSESQDKVWESVWDNYKKNIRLASVLKTTGLILPQILILAWLTINCSELNQLQKLVLAFDWLMGLLVLINFRFKIRPPA